MRENADILERIVTTFVNEGIENFLVIAENPVSRQKTGDNFRAVFGGKKSKIVAMLIEIFQQRKDDLGFILDSFVSVGHLDKIGEKEEVRKLLAQLMES